MSEAIETVKYINHKIEIFPDEHCENPIQTWDMLGEYFCWHKRYNLGNSKRFNTPDEVITYAKQTGSLLFNLYMYDHSGITLSLSNSHYPFNDTGMQVNWALSLLTGKKLSSNLARKDSLNS